MLRDKWFDLVYWCKDRPLSKLWRGTKDRVDAFIFCFLLLLVGIYSPRALRQIMIDSLKDTK
jgi:hypothetical protein